MKRVMTSDILSKAYTNNRSLKLDLRTMSIDATKEFEVYARLKLILKIDPKSLAWQLQIAISAMQNYDKSCGL